MKTETAPPPEKKPVETPEKTSPVTGAIEEGVVIDTSKMSEGKRRALEATEGARDQGRWRDNFAGKLFMGEFDLIGIYPFPEQTVEERTEGDRFLDELREILDKYADPDAIDREGEIPDELISRLAAIGAFGIKIPKEYGGRGLSQTNYCRAAMELGARCGNLTALLSAHQSIGVPQPLLMFGTEAQKKKYLPRCAKGEISAFALTEVAVGSDPSKISTRAEPSDDGKYFILNGEKLWCTNGTRAGIVVVMARTPAPEGKSGITAFIVEMDWPGVEIVQRCHFMGLRSLYNALVRFHDVRVPRENVILGEGRGLRVALSTLNTGRLTLPAACSGLLRECLDISVRWSNERRQWGAAIGEHAAIAEKLTHMAADAFATEASVLLTAELVDRQKADIRLEAAICKMWGTEKTWYHVNETMQIRGGRGYETADSLRARGEEAIPVERFLRDCRINLIFEGSSEIMRLFMAREALDPHLKINGAALDSRKPLKQRLLAALKAAGFYAWWYPILWLPATASLPDDLHPPFRRHLAYVRRTAKRLARAFFHAMLRHGAGLEKQQPLLARLTEIGAELFVLTAAVLRADSLIRHGISDSERRQIEDLIECLAAKRRAAIRGRFQHIRRHHDRQTYRFAQMLREAIPGCLQSVKHR